jgi:ribosomal-protein-alanine N-acetyltransferase
MEIRTERLLLREFVAADWQDVMDYQTDPRYLQFYAWESRTDQDVQWFVRMFLDMQTEKPRTKYQLAITLPESGRLIGNCGVRKASADATEAELGYELAPDVWGHGYATEAAYAMVSFGFRELGVHRICAYCNADNLASARVLERLGMQREGRLRERAYYKGRWWDELVYGLLEEEWASSRNGKE